MKEHNKERDAALKRGLHPSSTYRLNDEEAIMWDLHRKDMQEQNIDYLSRILDTESNQMFQKQETEDDNSTLTLSWNSESIQQLFERFEQFPRNFSFLCLFLYCLIPFICIRSFYIMLTKLRICFKN
jgi:hypothetical protein